MKHQGTLRPGAQSRVWCVVRPLRCVALFAYCLEVMSSFFRYVKSGLFTFKKWPLSRVIDLQFCTYRFPSGLRINRFRSPTSHTEQFPWRGVNTLLLYCITSDLPTSVVRESQAISQNHGLPGASLLLRAAT